MYIISGFTTHTFLRKVIDDVEKEELSFLHFDFLLKSFRLYPFRNLGIGRNILDWIRDYIENHKYLGQDSQKELLGKLYDLEKMVVENYFITREITYMESKLVQYKNFILIPVGD